MDRPGQNYPTGAYGKQISPETSPKALELPHPLYDRLITTLSSRDLHFVAGRARLTLPRP